MITIIIIVYVDEKIDKIQLTILTNQYNATIKHLQSIAKKARAMLFLIRTCRKFQVHSEKILPVRHDQVRQIKTKKKKKCIMQFEDVNVLLIHSLIL